MKRLFTVLLMAVCLYSCNRVPAPVPCQPLPSQRQLAWYPLEMYGFVHFNMNTFTGMEWGLGGESPALFNPDSLDCRQWVRVFKDAGFKGIIITAKHHDGFCLWPTATTEHSVKNSPWREGKGDVLRELSNACREAGLKFGVYLSPWDRNNEHYGTPEYLRIFREQLTELLTWYGDVFEVWFDGANGGTGYYGGANENRSVDRQSYYDWETTFLLAHTLQPHTVLFSDAGPDIRWVGNESGYAGRTNWAMLRRDEFFPGTPLSDQLIEGHEDGTHWLPAEVDVSIRPGWYYHEYEDHKIKSLPQLLDVYYNSVGRNASMLLNVPANRHGLIAPQDVAALEEFGRALRADFAVDQTAKVKHAVSALERGRKYSAAKAIDGKEKTFWATKEGKTSGDLAFTFTEPVVINRILLQEPIELGQRIRKFSIDALTDNEWKRIADETTIGYKRILRTEETEMMAIRINIEDSRAEPLLSNIAFYHAPKVLTEPVITRDRRGMASLAAADSGLEIRYTTDGSTPTLSSTLYTRPFRAENITVRAIAFDPVSGKDSPVASETFDVVKSGWSSPAGNVAANAFDDDAKTVYRLDTGVLPAELVVDLGSDHDISGFTYLPDQGRWAISPITDYEFYVSRNGRDWGSPVSAGEFQNIRNSPVLQRQHFAPARGRYIRLRALKLAEPSPASGIAEIGIITE